mgnify:CR=1 FL=1
MNCNAYLDESLVSSVLNALEHRGLYETAGDLLQHLQRYQEAKSMFERCILILNQLTVSINEWLSSRAACFPKLAELCRQHDPDELISVESKWGDFLFSRHRYEEAIERYIQSGNNKKAIEAALLAKRLDKAAELLQNLVAQRNVCDQ